MGASDFIGGIIFIAIILFIFYSIFTAITDSTTTEQSIFNSTNNERINAGLQPLIWNESLAKAAKLHAQDMCNNFYFDHTSKNGDTPMTRVAKQGLSGVGVGENIAASDPLSSIFDALLDKIGYSSQVSGWMNSPGHKENILNHSYGYIGVGTAICFPESKYVQDFAD